MGTQICHPDRKQSRIIHSFDSSKVDDSDICDTNDGHCIKDSISRKMNFKFSQEIIASKNLLVDLKMLESPPEPIDWKRNTIGELSFQNKTIIQLALIKQHRRKSAFKMIEIDVKNFIKLRKERIEEEYIIQQKIGQGGFGSVYKAISYDSNELRAVKTLKKKDMNNENKVQLITEMQILKNLDHPNIVKLYDLFQDEQNYYFVTQICQGGTVLNYINNNPVNEKIICKIMIQLLSAIKYMHSFNIVHRDIKLQNLVLVSQIKSQTDDIQIKLIDFGIAVKIDNQAKRFDPDVLGTLVYMAPQALKGVVGLEGDLWSCGILLYMMLTKRIPYLYKNEEELTSLTQKGHINRKNLHNIPLDVKVFLMAMLQLDPKKRITAEKAIKNKWLNKFALKMKTKRSAQFNEAASNLHKYNIQNNLVSMIESYLVFKKINQDQRHRLALVFRQIDTDKSGIIDVQQLKHFYRENSQSYDQSQINLILKNIDKNHSGKIDFNEFITAMYDRQKLFQVKSLEEAFEYFDKDKTGNLDKHQIRLILKGIQNEQVEFLFNELDKDSDNKISKKQFIDYLNTH